MAAVLREKVDNSTAVNREAQRSEHRRFTRSALSDGSRKREEIPIIEHLLSPMALGVSRELQDEVCDCAQNQRFWASSAVIFMLLSGGYAILHPKM
jgi:hypothetical protein